MRSQSKKIIGGIVEIQNSIAHVGKYNKWCQQLGGTYSSHTIGTTWINQLNR